MLISQLDGFIVFASSDDVAISGDLDDDDKGDNDDEDDDEGERDEERDNDDVNVATATTVTVIHVRVHSRFIANRRGCRTRGHSNVSIRTLTMMSVSDDHRWNLGWRWTREGGKTGVCVGDLPESVTWQPHSITPFDPFVMVRVDTIMIGF
jgi:hypothetical protein